MPDEYIVEDLFDEEDESSYEVEGLFEDESNKLEEIHKNKEAEKEQVEAARIAEEQAKKAETEDPNNWSAEQTKAFYKDNPPKNLIEAAKSRVAISIKELQEKNLMEILMPVKAGVEVGKKAGEGEVGKIAGSFAKGAAGAAEASIMGGFGDILEMLGDNIKESPYKEGMPERLKPSEEDLKFRKQMGEAVSKQGAFVSDWWKKQAMKGWEAPDPRVFQGKFMDDPWIKSAYYVGSAIPSLGAAYMITQTTGNPWIGAAVFGFALEGPGQYKEAKKAKLPLAARMGQYAASAIGTMILEKWPLEFLVKGGTGKVVKDMALMSMMEGGEEFLQQTWNNLLAIWGYDNARKWYQGTLESFVAGFGSGLILGGVNPMTIRLMENLEEKAKEKGIPEESLGLVKEQVASTLIKEKDTAGKILDEILENGPKEKEITAENIPEAGEVYEEQLSEMKAELEGAQKGGRGPGRGKQIFPDFWRNGWKRNEVLGIFDKLINGETLSGDEEERAITLLKEARKRVGKYPEEEVVEEEAEEVPFAKKPEAVEKPKKEEQAPLIEEAKKAIAEGKTAEEFVKAQEEPEALSAREWRTEMPKEAEVKEKINKSQIIAWTEKNFKIPIRGKATHRFGKKAGHYESRPELIRLKTWGELEVIPHEVAHHVDKQMKASLGKYWRREFVPKGEKQKALKELANLDYDQKQRRTSEGFAEYIRYYISSETAPEKAPTFHKFFTGVFLRENTDLAKNLAELKKKFTVWQRQGSENRILQQIDFTGEHTEEAGLLPMMNKAKEWILKNFHDEFYMIKKIEEQMGLEIGKNLRPSESPFALATYAKSKAGGIARTMVMEKMIDEYGNILGPGLKEILEPIPHKDMQTFLAYAVAKRAALLHTRGKESGIDTDDVKYIIEKYSNPEWDAKITELTQWSHHLIDWIVRAGGLGPAEAALIKELNPIYLPFKRAFIDKISVVKGAGGFVNRGQAVKTLKGSGRAILNPLEMMVGQATEMVNKAQKIRIAKATADLAGKEGVGGFIVKVPAPMKVTKFPIGEAIKQLADKNLIDIPENVNEAIDNLEEGDLDGFLTAFSQDWQYKGKDNIVSIWRNGEREFYELHPDFYRALSGIDMVKRGPILKIFGPFARTLRLGATSLKVSFGLVRNPFRDAFTYAVLSKRKTATIFDPIKGLYKDITKKPGDISWRYQAAGGRLSTQMGLDRATTMSVYDDLLYSKLKPLGKALKVVKHPFYGLWQLINLTRDILSVTEMAPRTMEVENNYADYVKKNPDWSEEDCFIQAFNDAQDVTVNFSKSGHMAKRINEVAAFFNVAIRGPEKVYRSLKERPVATVMKGLLWISSLAIGNWFRNRDKDWYKNLPLAYKYNNFWYELEDGTVIRLPIPFDLGIIFGSLPMAALDILEHKDPKYLEGLKELAMSQIPDPTPSMLGPVVDVARNRNFLDQPIESEGMQYRYHTERFKNYTTDFAKKLSKGFDTLGIKLSPIQIDYMLNSYSGGFSRQFPRGKAMEPADLPVLGDLVLRMPENPRRQCNEFFSEYELLSSKKAADICSRDELSRLNKIKPLYKLLVNGYFKQMKTHRENKDTDKIKKTYNLIGKILTKFGYE